jgi:hypothetical protein
MYGLREKKPRARLHFEGMGEPSGTLCPPLWKVRESADWRAVCAESVKFAI